MGVGNHHVLFFEYIFYYEVKRRVVVEQKVTSMAALKIKSYLLGPILNNFQRGLGKKILPFHFLNLHHEFGNSFFSKFWHINQKKFMKQKRQQIDHRVAWRRPFLRFQLHFWDIVAGATHRRGRSNPRKVGATKQIYILLISKWTSGCRAKSYFDDPP